MKVLQALSCLDWPTRNVNARVACILMSRLSQWFQFHTIYSPILLSILYGEGNEHINNQDAWKSCKEGRRQETESFQEKKKTIPRNKQLNVADRIYRLQSKWYTYAIFYLSKYLDKPVW